MGACKHIDYYRDRQLQRAQVTYYTQISGSNGYIVCNKAAILWRNHDLHLSFQAAQTPVPLASVSD